MVALCFSQWLFAEERRSIDRAVVAGYDRAFDAALEQAIQRCANNAPLCRSLEALRGTRWTDYIIGAVLRNCASKVDLDDALNYIVFRMLSPIGERGEPRKALFDLDPERQYDFSIGSSPILGRFRTFLKNDVSSVCHGKVRRVLTNVRPPGTMTITQVRKIADQQPGNVGAEEIPARPESGEKELYDDITDLLQRHSTPTMPLADIFQAWVDGMSLKDQRRRWGHSRADEMRAIIRNFLRDYATTQNPVLLALLDKPQPTPQPDRRPRPKPTPKSDAPDWLRDFRSILEVVQKYAPCSLAILARKRSHWLTRKPRDPTRPGTRLHDTLRAMVDAEALVKDGAKYELGPRFREFLPVTGTPASAT